MKKTFRTILAGALALFAVSCYDDSALREELESLSEKVAALETSLNDELDALNDRIEGLENIDFRVTNEYELQYSILGGEGDDAWVSTGVFVYDSGITAWEVSEDGNSVELVFGEAGSVVLPLYSVSNLGLSRTDFFLRYEGSKTVELTAEGLSDCYVMSKPDGWKTTLVENQLTVTAPTAAAVKIGAAEETGLVLVHATTADGKCRVAKIEVSAGKGLTIEIADNGDMKVTNSYSAMTLTEEGEVRAFENFQFGIVADPETFLGDIDTYLKEYYEYGGVAEEDALVMFYNVLDNSDIPHQPYEEGVYETDTFEGSVADFFKKAAWAYDDMPYGETFLFWVAPLDANGKIVVDAMEYTTYTRFDYSVEVTGITHKEATLNVNVKGATKWIIGVFDPSMYGGRITVDQYFNTPEGNAWQWMQQGIIGEAIDYGMVAAYEDGEHTISVSELNRAELNFDTEYSYWVFPYVEGTEYTDYESQFKPYIKSFRTNPLVPGSEATVTFGEVVEEFTKVSVPVEVADGTKVYYQWYSAASWTALEAEGDAAVNADIITNGSIIEMSRTLSESGLEPGEQVVLAAFVVDSEGKYSEYVTKPCAAKSLPTVTDETVTATVGQATIDYTSIKLSITPSASAEKSYYRYFAEADYAKQDTEEKMVKFMLTGSGTAFTAERAANYTSAKPGSKYILVVVSVTAEGKYNIQTYDYTTPSYPYNTNIGLEFGSATLGEDNKVTMVIDVQGGATHAMMYYYYNSTLSSVATTLEGNVMKASPTINTTYYVADVVDGKATFTFAKKSASYWCYVTAYTKGETGVTALAESSKVLAIDVTKEVTPAE